MGSNSLTLQKCQTVYSTLFCKILFQVPLDIFSKIPILISDGWKLFSFIQCTIWYDTWCIDLIDKWYITYKFGISIQWYLVHQFVNNIWMVNKNSDCLFHFENKAMVLKYLLFTFLFFCNNKIYTLYKNRLFIIDIQYIKKMMLCNHKSITSGQKDIYINHIIYICLHCLIGFYC